MPINDRNFPLKPFYLVRHGESFANRFSYPSGRMDTRLTRAGRAQAQEAAAIMADLPLRPELLITSNLHRARQTATTLHEVLECPYRIDRGLSEQHYGVIQGINKTRAHEDGGAEWWRMPEGGERFSNFRRRVLGRMAWWLHRTPGVPVFVGHSGLFSAFGDYYGHVLRGIPNAGAFLFEPVLGHGHIGWQMMQLRPAGEAHLYDWIRI